MSKPKKSKSEAECDEGSSCSTYTGGGIIETCIIHFPDVNASNTIVSLSNIENPSERLEKLNDICRRRLLESQGSGQRMTDICSQVPSAYSKSNCMGITGSAISVSREIYIAFKHLLSLNHFPNSNMVEEPQYLKQLKTVVSIICSEKLKVMTYLLVRLSIIDHVIKNTFVNQLI